MRSKNTVKSRENSRKIIFKRAFFIVKNYRALLIFFLHEIIILFLYQQDVLIRVGTDIPNM